MSKVSFKKANTNEVIEAEAEEVKVKETKVVKAESQTPAAPEQQSIEVGGISGEIGNIKLSPPRINIVQATGDLSSEYAPGGVVFDKRIELIGGDPKNPTVWSDPVYFSVLYGRLQYVENLDYDSDDTPDIVDSMAEVEARGGWTEWRSDDKGNRVEPPWIPLLTACLCVEATNEHAESEFNLVDPNGKPCDLALWHMRKSAFTRAGKFLINAGKTSLRGPDGHPKLTLARFSLQVRREKLGTYQVYVPKVGIAERHSPEYVEWLESLL
jgi:hypothetical protein